MVTPPLFRLDPNQHNTLRIIGTGSLAGEKESLYWLCVTRIPPKNGDVWASDSSPEGPHAQVNMEVNTHICVKLITRPADISGSLMQAAELVQWRRDGNTVRAKNSSPYYINLHSLIVNGNRVERPEYIPPFSE